MKEVQIPIANIIKDNRTVHRLQEQGFIFYSDIFGISLDQLREIPGVGEVSAQRAFLDIQSYKESINESIIKAAMDLVDRVGIARAIEIMENAE